MEFENFSSKNNVASWSIKIDNLLNNFHTKKAYVDLLQFVKNFNEKNRNTDYKARALFIKIHFRNNPIEQNTIDKLLLLSEI